MRDWGNYLKHAGFMESAEKVAPALDDIAMLAARKLNLDSKTAPLKKISAGLKKEGFGSLAAGLTGAGLGGLAGAAGSSEGKRLRGALAGAALGAAGGVAARKGAQHLLGRPTAKKLVSLGWRKGAPLTGQAAEEGRSALQRYQTGLAMGAGAGGLAMGAGAGGLSAGTAAGAGADKVAEASDTEPYRHYSLEQDRANRVAGGVGTLVGAGLLAYRAFIGGKTPFSRAARGIGGAAVGGLAGGLTGAAIQGVLSGKPKGELYTGQELAEARAADARRRKEGRWVEEGDQIKGKQAALDMSLGSLYTRYGPPLTKHAALSFYTYELDKEAPNREALGEKFCKLASLSELEPWAMARMVVTNYPHISKEAGSEENSPSRELSRFYVAWSDGVIKEAGISSSAVSKAKVVGKSLGRHGASVAQNPESNYANYLRGAAILGGLGIGSSAVTGNQHPASGEVYA